MARHTAVTKRETRSEFLRHRLMSAEERQRLFRFCLRLTGEPEVAEDLTQEALAEAWRQADTLRDPAKWRSWLFGIAHNYFLRWQRQHARRMARQVSLGSEILELTDSPGSDAFDLQTMLEKQELAHLLDRALNLLTPSTRELLESFYLKETPQSQMAKELQTTENNVAVRLHRGKQALRKVLQTELAEESAAYGLFSWEQFQCQETRLWCPFCGQTRLIVVQDVQSNPRFSCSHCYFVLGPRRVDYPSDCILGHDSLPSQQLVRGVQGFKPMMNRLSQYWQSYLEDGREKGSTTCLGCGKPLPLLTSRPAHLLPRPFAGFHINCTACGKIHVLLPSAFAFTTPVVQQFWKKHPRMRFRPARGITGSAFVIRVESLAENAHQDIIFRTHDYRLLEAPKDRTE